VAVLCQPSANIMPTFSQYYDNLQPLYCQPSATIMPTFNQHKANFISTVIPILNHCNANLQQCSPLLLVHGWQRHIAGHIPMYILQGWPNCGPTLAELCWYNVGKLTLGQCHIDDPVSMSSCQCWPNIGRTMLVYGWQHHIGQMSYCQPYTNVFLARVAQLWLEIGRTTLVQGG
jgi:hypothetical protein